MSTEEKEGTIFTKTLRQLEQGRQRAEQDAFHVDNLEDLVAEQGNLIRELEGKVQDLTEENVALESALRAYEQMEQDRVESWDMLRHIFLLPSSASSVTLPPMASEATSNGDTVGKPTTAATALRMGKPTKPIYDPTAHESAESFCRLGIIAPYLQAFTSLTTLSLSGAAADRRALEAFSMNVPTTITSLALLRCGISGDECMQGVLVVLAHPKRHLLRTLDLSANALGSAGASRLAGALNRLPSLCITKLVISNCRIGRQGAEALCVALQHNTSISALHAQYNEFGDDGCTAVGDMLLTNTSLSSLNISYNNISDSGVRCLAASVASVREVLHPDGVTAKPGLTMLRIAGNMASANGLKLLATALPTVSIYDTAT